MATPAIGVLLPTMSDRNGAPGDVAAAARHAEDLGLESVWVVDQLVAGTGYPVLDSGIALAAAATATSRVGLAYGVLIVPLHPLAWLAKQVASLQQVSGGRLILGVGAGGDRHSGSWAAGGVPRTGRGRRTDHALQVLPELLAGRPARLGQDTSSPAVTLSPLAPAPPVIVGGMSEAALQRAARYGDGWFPLPAPLPVIADQVPAALHTGPPIEIAARLAEQAAHGAERVVISVAAGNWFRQVELVAQARDLASADELARS